MNWRGYDDAFFTVTVQALSKLIINALAIKGDRFSNSNRFRFGCRWWATRANAGASFLFREFGKRQLSFIRHLNSVSIFN